jgi:Methyltransferase domain
VGSGHGSVTQHLARGRRFVATDVSDTGLSVLRSRFADWPDVDVRRMDLRAVDMGETFDSTIKINLLEHIYDEADAWNALASSAASSGSKRLLCCPQGLTTCRGNRLRSVRLARIVLQDPTHGVAPIASAEPEVMLWRAFVVASAPCRPPSAR